VNTLISKNLNIAVLGAGESGVAAARLLAAEGANVTVLDSAPEDVLKAKQVVLAPANVQSTNG
jgi:UDP-N-acetylmuramoylalanine-D-glutamate ligase